MYDEDAAKAALRALGISFPSQALIQSWIQASRAEDRMAEQQRSLPTEHLRPALVPEILPPPAVEVSPSRHPRGYSRSRLEPALRENGTLQRQKGPRKPGRPRVVASWFPAVAQAMADGTTLRDALKQHSIALDKGQIRALYRNEEFKRLYWEARRASSGSKSPTTK